MPRPRSERAHGQVLDAAARLFAERGIDGASMDAIAAAAGVSKATIYKHWPDKAQLALEVMDHLHGPSDRPVTATADVRADIVALLEYYPPKPRSELRGRIMPHLMAYAAQHPEFGRAWRARALDPPRLQLLDLLRRAVAEGHLPPTLDLELTAIALLGPMVYRNLLRVMGADAPKDLASRLVDDLWRARGDVRGSR